MKLALKFLEKVIKLPSTDANVVRRLLDDIGLEVKDVGSDSRGVVYTIETLANRGDHLSAIGAAREIAARTGEAVLAPALFEKLSTTKASIPVRRVTEKCTRYAILEARIPTKLSLTSEITPYMEDSEALHPLVTMLNYVQSEIGQPMHAFDASKIEGEIVVECIEKEAQIEALDKKKYTVPSGSIVIKDSVKIIAVAGVIGCANSMVTDTTTHVMIESALFCPIAVRKTARKMGLITDAAYAFERGVDPNSWLTGLKRAAYLAQTMAKGVEFLGFSETEQVPFSFPKLECTLSYFQNELGTKELTIERVQEILTHLGYRIELSALAAGDFKIKIEIPSWRVWDVESREDVLEDVARSFGYGKIAVNLPPLDYKLPELNDRERITQKIEPVLIGNGFLEVITRSYYSAKDAQLIEQYAPAGSSKHITLKNSLESSYSHLRLSNIAQLASLAEQNNRRGVQSVKVFEFCQLFGLNRGRSDEYQHEVPVLTIAQSGRWNAGEWRQGEDRAQCVARFTGMLEQLFAAFHASLVIKSSDNSFFHPGCQGELFVANKSFGFFGLIHPGLQSALDLKNEMLYVELDVDALATLCSVATYQKQSEYPAIRRDLTLRIGAKQFAADVTNSIRTFAPFAAEHREIVRDIQILDDFKKKEEDFRRVTYRITFQSQTRTLEHALIDSLMKDLFSHLSAQGTGVV